MDKAKLIIRILFGLMMLVFGLNKFLNFMPMPELPSAASNFMSALVESGYMMKVVGIVEVLAGILLLANKFVPLALVIIFPVMLNAFMFHLFLDLKGIPGALVAIAMNIFLFFAYKPSYEEVLRA
ncbi:MAG: DoxX family membrane protein [Bacteroidota bacterium]